MHRCTCWAVQEADGSERFRKLQPFLRRNFNTSRWLISSAPSIQAPCRWPIPLPGWVTGLCVVFFSFTVTNWFLEIHQHDEGTGIFHVCGQFSLGSQTGHTGGGGY